MELGGLPNLVDRAARFLAERGPASEAELASVLFGGQSAAWTRLLDGVLGADGRFSRDATGWRLRVGPGPAEAAPDVVALAVLANGPQPYRHRALAIAAVRTGPAGPAEWHSLVRPERPTRLPGYLAKHGLDAESLETAPAFEELAPSLLEFLGDRPIAGLDVAQNVAFLQFALRRAGLPGLVNPLLELARDEVTKAGMDGRRRPDLGRLARRFGVPVPPRRDVLALARTTAAIAARARLEIAPGAPALGPRRAHDTTARRALTDPRTVESLPATPGIYRFVAATGATLYVGKATSLRERVGAYISSDLHRTRQMAGLVAATDRVEVTPTPTVLEAELLELREILRLRPLYNVQHQPAVQLAYICADLAAAPAWRAPRFRVLATPEDSAVGPLPATAARRLVALARRRHPWPGGRQQRPGVAMRRQETARMIWEELLAGTQQARLPAGLTPAAAARCVICTRGASGQLVAVCVGVTGYAGSVEVDEPAYLAPALARCFESQAGPVTAATLAELYLALRWAEGQSAPVLPAAAGDDSLAARIDAVVTGRSTEGEP